MEAKSYYTAIRDASQVIFDKSINTCSFLGTVNDFSTALQDWAQIIPNGPEIQMLSHAIEQIEISFLSLLSGIYRQSFTALRLSMEMLFGAVYFSAHRLEFIEWQNGSGDLNWRTINDENNGVLSPRFAKAFLPEVSHLVTQQRTKASSLYRELSEFVHGNYATWNLKKPSLTYDSDLIAKYENGFQILKSIAQFILCLRYLKELDVSRLGMIEIHVIDELRSIPEIRAIFGGSVER